GQPLPELYLVSEEKSGIPHAAQRYTPSSLLFRYLPVNAGSVPFCRNIRYCSGVSSFLHSFSVFRIFPSLSVAASFAIYIASACSSTSWHRPNPTVHSRAESEHHCTSSRKCHRNSAP